MYGFREMRTKKSLGQVFLVNSGIAEAEAAHSYDKTVIEIGPGPGILTNALCRNAKKVIAVEKDSDMCTILKHHVKSKRLKLINKDFFDATDEELELGKVDIVIANIPYNLSSKIIDWLGEKNMQAVLCLQKEFVEHMLAVPDTRSYSRLSVTTSLMFKVTKIMSVPKGNFRPIPKVDSTIIYMKPKEVKMEKRALGMIGLIMQHKKKTVMNAIQDSHSYLGKEKKELSQICAGISHRNERVFKLGPQEILKVATELDSLLK